MNVKRNDSEEQNSPISNTSKKKSTFTNYNANQMNELILKSQISGDRLSQLSNSLKIYSFKPIPLNENHPDLFIDNCDSDIDLSKYALLSGYSPGDEEEEEDDELFQNYLHSVLQLYNVGIYATHHQSNSNKSENTETKIIDESIQSCFQIDEALLFVRNMVGGQFIDQNLDHRSLTCSIGHNTSRSDTPHGHNSSRNYID